MPIYKVYALQVTIITNYLFSQTLYRNSVCRSLRRRGTTWYSYEQDNAQPWKGCSRKGFPVQNTHENLGDGVFFSSKQNIKQ